MKLQLRFFFLCLVLALSAFPVSAQHHKISISADFWFPFNGDPRSEKPGYMIEIARQIFEVKGYDLEYKLTPWSRSVSDLMIGAVDAIVGAAHGDAPEAIFHEEPLGIGSNALFTLASSGWNYSGVESLKSITLGVIADYSYGETLTDYIAANKSNRDLVQEIGGDTAFQQNIKKLELGRIGALAEVPEVFWATIDLMKLDRKLFRQAGTTPDVDPLYIAFSPKNPKSKEYAQILSAGIRELRASGELKKILDRYNMIDWKSGAA